MLNKNSTLPPLDYLLAFEASAEKESFSRAAKILNISESAVSRKVKLLELHYNQKFFIRGGRSIEITEVGKNFHDATSNILSDLRNISENFSKDKSSQQVTLAATNSVATLWLMPKLTSFNNVNKAQKIKVVSSDNDDECLAEDVDLTILRGDGRWTGYQEKLLFGETIFPVCSPDFIIENSGKNDVKSLLHLSLIGVANKHTEWMTWSTWLSTIFERKTTVDQSVLLNTYPLAIEAAINGLGVALGWAHLVDHLIESGKLIRPFGKLSVRTNHGYFLLKAKNTRKFKERDNVEAWLLSLSEKRKRYKND